MRLHWVRRDRYRLRSAASCDRIGWRSLASHDAVLEWPLTAGGPVAEPMRWLIERDGVIVGGLALAAVAVDLSEPLHPWEELDSSPPSPGSDPRSPGRLVTRLFAGPASVCAHPDEIIGWAVDAPLKALLQQAGGRRLVARVPLEWLPEPAPSGDPGDAPSRGIRWTPSAWLQQFAYRSLDARAVSIWTDAGFRLEGFYGSDPPVARLVWDNTRG